jgi:glycosyltransferase involved in cell wall biosynthesis
MRASVIIPSHNEGELLWKTVDSCIESTSGLDYEIVIADDCSSDDSLQLLRGYLERAERAGHPDLPKIRIKRTPRRSGVSLTRCLGVAEARGEVFLFLDGHCRPYRGAIQRLVEAVEALEGKGVVMPRIPHLDPQSWKFDRKTVGYGFCMDLLNFECAWLRRDQLDRSGRFYRTPAVIGCSFAASRALYDEVLGFDPHMIEWGAEDLDFGLKAWLLGNEILLDAGAAIGHRFRSRFENYSVAEESVLVNKIRMARKNFSDPVFADWVAYTRSVELDPVWERTWHLYSQGLATVDREREYLMARRVRDEFDYAERFGLDWPRR